MGLETACRLRIGRRTEEGRALLESHEIVFRGDARLRIPLAEIRSVAVDDGVLAITHAKGTTRLELGPAAARWAEKIQKPKGLLDKLGAKPEYRVAVIGVDDASFLSDLRARCRTVSIGRAAKGSDMIVFGATRTADLRRLAALRRSLVSNGAIWVTWPKGRPELKEDHVRAAALAVGLVDVKVAAFSATLSALKLVIPVARR